VDNTNDLIRLCAEPNALGLTTWGLIEGAFYAPPDEHYRCAERTCATHLELPEVGSVGRNPGRLLLDYVVNLAAG
jgi:hypothetical protein